MLTRRPPRPFHFIFLDLSNDLNMGSHFENHYNPLPSYYLDSGDGLKPSLRTFGYMVIDLRRNSARTDRRFAKRGGWENGI